MEEIEEVSSRAQTFNFYLLDAPLLMTCFGHSRPLRTYSKRSTPDNESEPARKKRRVGDDSLQPQRDETVAALPQLPVQLLLATPAPRRNVEKGSILNYFKSTRSSSSADSSDLVSDPDKLRSTPVSSPPIHRTALYQAYSASGRVKTLPEDQTVKPKAHAAQTVVTEGELEQQLAIDGEKEERGQQLVIGGRNDEEGQRGESRALQDVEFGRMNARRTLADGERRPKKSKASFPRRTKSAPTVQTTLNLSTQPAFTECRICNMVYNPVHPNDVRLHTRRHRKALQRAISCGR
jgi:hypothetical protein